MPTPMPTVKFRQTDNLAHRLKVSLEAYILLVLCMENFILRYGSFYYITYSATTKICLDDKVYSKRSESCQRTLAQFLVDSF